MSQTRLEIVIDSLNMASSELKAVQRDLGALDKQSDKSTQGLAAMKQGWGAMIGVIGGATAAIFAAKKAYDFTKEGAALEAVEIRFDRLAESIGTTGDMLLGDLRTATRGMVSDAEAMAAASDFMGLGLAKTHDQAVRLSAAAGALNMNMNQLVLTLTNKTTMRFDALGVAVDGFGERLEGLEEQGYDTQAAFTEAFLQQAEAQIEKVGHAADTTAGRIQVLEVRWANIVDSFKRGVADSKVTDLFLTQAEAGYALQDALDSGAISYGEWFSMNNRVSNGLEASKEVLEELDVLVRSQPGTFDSWSYAMSVASERQAELIDGTQGLADSVNNYKGELDHLHDMMSSTFTEDFEDAQKKTRDLMLEANNLSGQIVDLESKSWLTTKQQEELESLKGDLDDVEGEIDEVGAAWERQSAKMLASIAEQVLAVDGWTNEELAAYASLVGPEGLGLVDEGYQNMLANVGIAGQQMTNNIGDQSSEFVDYMMDNQNAVGDLQNVINETEGKTVIIDVVTRFSEKIHADARPGGVGHAAGGPVEAGIPYPVGEHGPEMFVPGEPGQIVAAQNLGLGGGQVDLGPLLAEQRETNRKLGSLARDLATAVMSQDAKMSGMRG